MTAENGQLALDKISSRDFDVVLMDCQMPVMDGYTTAGRIREMNKSMPVMAMTADAMAGAEQKCLDAGYSHYMTKPVDIDALIEHLAELLGGELLTEDQADESVQVKTSDVDKKEGEAGKIRSSLPMSSTKYRDIVKKFITRLEKQLAVIDAAWYDRNYDELKRLGHWLKGSAGSVGFAAFVEPSAEFEQFAINKDDAKLEAAINSLHALFKRIETLPEDDVEQLEKDQVAVPAQLKISDVAIKENDEGKIYSSLPTSNEKYRNIVQKFISRLEDQLAVIDAAWSDRNYDELKRLGHWLKGSAGSVGFAAFVEPAAEFEQFAINKDDAKLEAAINSLHSLFKRIEIQTDQNNSYPEESKETVSTMKDYVIPEKVICSLFDTSPHLMHIVEKFTRQLENSLYDIDTVVGQNNFEEIRKFAYWLRSIGGTKGYGEFTEPASDLEASAKTKKTDVIKHTIGIIKEIHNRMEPLEIKHESGAGLRVKLVSK